MISPIRIGGLASGMDIDRLVSDMMRVQRMKADKLYQDRQVLRWQQEDYRSINSLMLTFKNTVFDMRLQATLMKYSAVISGAQVADVTAGSAAREGSYTLRLTTWRSRLLRKAA